MTAPENQFAPHLGSDGNAPKQQALQTARRQPMMFTEYDGSITRRLAERITVVDAEIIQVKLMDTDMKIEQKLC